jgi:hypothetical protein
MNRIVQFWGQGYSNPPTVGLALTPCTITATVGGNVVFSGPIPTTESSDILRLPTDQQVLFTCEIPLLTAGNTLYTIPVSLDITGDDVFLEQIESNYSEILNPVYTPEQSAIVGDQSAPVEEKIAIWELVAVPPLSAEDIAVLTENVWATTEPILITHNLMVTISSGPTGFYGIAHGDARSNVVITNATYSNPPPDPRPPNDIGSWGWEVEVASGQTATMAFDMNVMPGEL